MTIKKAYVELVELLEANKGKKVSTILDDIIELCSSKTQGSTVIRDAEGNVIAIFCYYHKQWELLSSTPYGAKASSATGFNTMCKVGTSKWTKQQRLAKQANANILTDVAKGTIEPSDIVTLQADIEHNRKVIDQTDMPEGFASEDDLMKHLKG